MEISMIPHYCVVVLTSSDGTRWTLLNFFNNFVPFRQHFNMVGHLAKRAQFGLILPSTNTSVEAEFNRMPVPGTHFKQFRIYISDLS